MCFGILTCPNATGTAKERICDGDSKRGGNHDGDSDRAGNVTGTVKER